LGFALILQLTGTNGSQQFDKLTKTKTVESILTSLDSDGIKCYVDHLFKQTDEISADQKFASFCPLHYLLANHSL
jgi:DNA polymerase phi